MVNGLGLLYIAAAITVASCQNGPCEFQSWWQKLSWFTEYDFTTPSVQWHYNFLTDKVEWKPDVTTKIPVTYTCLRQYKHLLPNADGNQIVFYYIWQWEGTAIYTCRAMYETDHGLFERNVVILPSEKDIQAELCVNKIQTKTVFGNWVPITPVKRDKVIACPMPEGTYQATYQLTTDTSVQCTADSGSTITVTDKGTLVINTCYSGSVNYEYPLKGRTLKCLSMLNGAVLESEENGRILLLADMSTPSTKPKFYCARYNVTDSYKVSLSIDTGDDKISFCKRTQTQDSTTDPADTYGNKYVYLGMTNTDKSPLPTCEFDVTWRTKWQYKELVIGGDYRALTVEYKVKDFTLGPEGSSIPPVVTFTCEHKQTSVMSVGGETKDVVLSLVKTSAAFRVTENINMGDFMLYRHTPYTGPTRSEEWKKALGLTRNEVEVFVKSPPPTTGACNLTPGTYYTTFKESTTMACEGNTASQTIITQDSVEFKTCSTSNTYEKPVNTKLKCIGTFKEAVIDTDFSNEQGDYLILQWTDPATNNPSYYCAKYKEIQGKLKLSLHIPKTRGAACKASASYEDASDAQDNKYLAFILDPDFPTTTSTTTTTPTTTTTSQAPPSTTTTTAPGSTEKLTTKVSNTTPSTTSTTTPSPTSPAHVKFEVSENPNEVVGSNTVNGTLSNFKDQLSFSGDVTVPRVSNTDIQDGEMGVPAGTKVSTVITPGISGQTTQQEAANKICEGLESGRLKLRNVEKKELKYVKGSCKIYFGVGMCKSFPCHHDGQCVDKAPSGYECVCPTGYNGRKCENVRVTNAPVVDKTAIIVILIVAAIIIFLLVVLFVCICHKNRRKQKEPMLADELGGHDVARKWAPDYSKDTIQKPA